MADIRLNITITDSGGAVLGKIEQGLENVDKKSKGSTASLAGMDSILSGIGTGIGIKVFDMLASGASNVLHAIPAMVAGLVDAAGAVTDLSGRTQISTTALQEMAVAGGQVGLSQEEISGGLVKLQHAMAEGSQDTRDALAGIGISFKTLAAEKPEKQLEDVVTALNKIEDPAKRTATAMDLMGRGGAALLPLGEGLHDIMQKAQDLGIVMSEKVVKAADDMGDKWDLLGRTVTGLKNNLVSVITTSAPLQTFLSGITDIIGSLSKSVQDGSGSWQSFVDDGVMYTMNALLALLDVVDFMIDAWTVVSTVVSAVGEVFITVGGAISDILSFVTGGLIDFRKAVENVNVVGDALRLSWKALEFVIASLGQGMISLGKGLAFIAEGYAYIVELTTGNKGAVDAVHGWQAGLDSASASIEAFKLQLSDEANAIVNQTEKSGDSARVTDTLRKSLEGLRDKMQASRTAIEEAAGAHGHLAGAPSKALQKALEESAKWVSSFNLEIQKMNDALASSQMHGLDKTFNDIGNQAAQMLAKLQAEADLDKTGEKAKHIEEMKKKIEEWSDASKNAAQAQDMIAQQTKHYEELKTATTSYIDAYEKLHPSLDLTIVKLQMENAYRHQEIDLMEALGEIAPDVAGKLRDMADETEALAEKEAKLQSLSDTFAGIGQVVGATSHLFEALGGHADSAFGKLLKGVGELAQDGQQFASAMASGNVFGMVSAGIEGVGHIISTVKSIFSKPSWERVGEEAGHILGMKVSETLAKDIEQKTKDFHITVGAAALLDLDKAIDESHRNVTSFATNIIELMQDAANGLVPMKEGVKEIGTLFNQVQEDGSAAAKKLSVQMIQSARAAGLAVPEITAAVKAALDMAIAGVTAITANLTPQTTEDANAQAYIFAATFWGKVKEDGISAAASAMHESYLAFEKAAADGGFDISAVMGPIDQIMGLLDDKTKGLLDGINGLTQAMKGLGDSGYMTTGAFEGFEEQAGSAFKKLTDAGVDSKTALLAIAPYLAEIQQESARYGLTIDANTQALIDQANAAGVAFPIDPMQKVVDILTQIAIKLGAISGAADDAGNHLSHMGDNIPNNAPGTHTTPGGQQYTVPDHPTGPPNGSNYPHGANGLVVAPRAGGSTVVLGEAGQTEVAAPVAAILQQIGTTIAGQLNSGNDDRTIVVNVNIPFTPMLTFIEKAQKANALRILSSQVQDFG